jgi:hypothetical protein
VKGLSARSDSQKGPLTRRYAPTSPRKRGEVNQTSTSIQLKTIMLQRPDR